MRLKDRRDPWINKEINKLTYTRDLLHNTATTTGDPKIWYDYKYLRNRMTDLIKTEKQKYFDNMGLTQDRKETLHVYGKI